MGIAGAVVVAGDGPRDRVGASVGDGGSEDDGASIGGVRLGAPVGAAVGLVELGVRLGLPETGAAVGSGECWQHEQEQRKVTSRSFLQKP